MHRDHWLRQIERLDPGRDFAEIYRIMVAHEFPWDMNQSLGLALYRTYAVPSIGELLGRTAEFTERTRKRYEDTGLILDAVLENGFTSAAGRAAIRRMNQMHNSYEISNDDFRYVLSTFVVIPIRWMDRNGWRPFTEAERAASANYYRELGRHMGIRDSPTTHEEFADLLDGYESRHFGYSPGGRAVSDATLNLMIAFYPRPAAPLVRRLSMALLDEPLLDAFRYPHPSSMVRAIATGGLRMRARIERRLPPRRQPLHARQQPHFRLYRDGYDVAQLGTFPQGGCPVAHAARTATAGQ
jgi:ER-bound oxygenase mpaB/B'/Rubber oxygenase, catalytic domain